jgi:hypothetical protein
MVYPVAELTCLVFLDQFLKSKGNIDAVKSSMKKSHLDLHFAFQLWEMTMDMMLENLDQSRTVTKKQFSSTYKKKTLKEWLLSLPTVKEALDTKHKNEAYHRVCRVPMEEIIILGYFVPSEPDKFM